MNVALPLYYTPKFYRHLNHLVRNGFYARDLDADDFAFIESVRVKGIANGDLPSTNVCLIEELEFWHFPYTIAPHIERRVGKKPRPAETLEEYEQRKARSNKWHAQRKVREEERAIAAIELKREEREQAAAKHRRIVRQKITDAEWEAAAPKHAVFGKIIKGVYVPQWKVDEQDEKARIAFEAEQRDQRRERRAQREQERRETILQEARDNLAAIEKLEQKWNQTANPYPTRASLMQAILTLLGRTPGYAWDGLELRRSLGCNDIGELNAALDELVASGQLKRGVR